mmetsp:Transcript_105912/g.297798  ORF Transcript_105912/g.297798 Transcript_105912/m.297798 type:complete len:214 (-) Transcript_105912:130-771(-)
MTQEDGMSAGVPCAAAGVRGQGRAGMFCVGHSLLFPRRCRSSLQCRQVQVGPRSRRGRVPLNAAAFIVVALMAFPAWRCATPEAELSFGISGGIGKRLDCQYRLPARSSTPPTARVTRFSAVMPPPPPQGGGGGDDGEGDDKKLKIELASLDEAAEKVSKTAEGVSDITRKASFEFRKLFGFDGGPVLGALLVGWFVVDYVLKNTTLGFYLGF